MTAGDLAAVLVALAAIAGFVMVLVALQSLLRALRELRGSVDAFQREMVPLLDELRGTVRDTGAEVERVDQLLDAAETISSRVDSASRLSYLAFRAPVIRVVAFFHGVGRFGRRLVRRPSRRSRPAGRDRTQPSRRAA